MDKVLFNFHDTILLVTIYQCVLLALFFFIASRQNKISKIFIAAFFLCNAAVPLDILISFGAGFREYAIYNFPNLFYVFEFGYWLQGPFLLWYVRSLVYQDIRLKGSDIAYILPYLLYLMHQLLVYHSLPTSVKEMLHEQYDLLKESYTVLYVVFARESLRFYFGVIAALELRRYFIGQREKLNTVHEESLTWLKVMVCGLLILWGLSVFVAVGLVLNIVDKFNIPIGKIGLFVNYNTCFLFGAILVVICKGSMAAETVEKVPSIKPRKNKASGNTEYIVQLEEVMRDKKPFLDPTLTPGSLAGQLGVSVRVLSAMINQQYHCNFFMYINRFRIEEAKRLLIHTEDSTKSVLDIMYQVGFNSKATFNAMFKKLEGMTPREYRKSHFGDVDDELDQDFELDKKESQT